MRKPLVAIFFFVLPLAGLALSSNFAWADGSTPQNISDQLPIGYVLDQIQGTALILPPGGAKPVIAEADVTVQPGDEIITKPDSEVSLAFNDSAMVRISGGSEVKVEELDRPDKNSFVSRLKLITGLVLSQVAKLGQGRSSFEVETGGVVCGVRGTVFEVQKDKNLVQSNTYEGVVEMKNKDGSAQKVPADRHSAFDTDQQLFLIQSVLTKKEQERYRDWQKYSDLMERRQHEREAALKSFDSLPRDEKAQLWKGLQQANGHDQFLVLRIVMKEKNPQDRLQAMDRVLKARHGSVRGREEHEKNLKKIREKKEE